MQNHNKTATAFWHTKLGHAALASIAAMVLMIALSSQIVPGPASAASPAYPMVETGMAMEVA